MRLIRGEQEDASKPRDERGRPLSARQQLQRKIAARIKRER